MTKKPSKSKLINQFLKNIGIEQWRVSGIREMRLALSLSKLIDQLRAEPK